MAPRKCAVLDMEDAPKWVGATFAAWRTLLHEPDDVWDVYDCTRHHFPDLALIHQYDVIILGGSHYGINDDLPWIRELLLAIPQYIAAQPGPRIVGCCFGHQALSKALGGSVGSNPSGRFVLGCEQIVLDADAMARVLLPLPATLPARPLPIVTWQLEPSLSPTGPAPEGSTPAAAADRSPLVLSNKDSAIGAGAGAGAAADSGTDHLQVQMSGEVAGQAPPPGVLRLVESHGDQVLRMPACATLLASSATAEHEMWTSHGKVLSFQFHPEMPCQLALDKIWPALQGAGRLLPEEATASRAALEDGRTDASAFFALIRHFIRHGAAAPAAAAAGDCSQAAAATADATAAAAPPSPTACAGAPPAGSGPPVAPLVGSEAAAVLPAPAGPAPQAPPPGAVAEGGGGAAGHSERDARVAASADQLAAALRGAFETGLGASTAEYRLLTAVNGVAAEQYRGAADAAEVLAGRSSELQRRHADAEGALATLPAVEQQLEQLATLVAGLDDASRQLARQVGVSERNLLWQ